MSKQVSRRSGRSYARDWTADVLQAASPELDTASLVGSEPFTARSEQIFSEASPTAEALDCLEGWQTLAHQIDSWQTEFTTAALEACPPSV